MAVVTPGVDYEWPASDDLSDTIRCQDELKWCVHDALMKKGWSLLQTPSSAEVREGLLAQAEQLPYEAPKKEFAADLLGEGGSGKICHLQQGEASDFFLFYDHWTTALCSLLEPLAWQTMGFKVSGRSEGMVWKSFANDREEKQLTPKPLDEDDVEAGLITAHLNFIQRRKLCCLYFLCSEGGTISLRSKGEDNPRVQLDVSTDQLLVFRCDEMTFAYRPHGEFTIYSTWVVDDLHEIDLQGVVFDPAGRSALQGLVRGIGMPSGPRIGIGATHSCIGGSGNDALQNWNMFATGTDAFVRVPQTRFDAELYSAKDEAAWSDFIPGLNSYAVHGALIDDDSIMSSAFDYEFFGLRDAAEAAAFWPKQRMVLETGYVLLAEAGFTRETLHNRFISSFIGDSAFDWFNHMMINGDCFKDPSLAPHMWKSINKSITATRVAYVFGLRGATASIDTACSSGLIAFSLAVASMRSPQKAQFRTQCCGTAVEGAITGGVSIHIGPEGYVGACAASMLSHKGRCWTFDKSADGFGRGEGTSLVYSTAVNDDAEKDRMIACCIGAVANENGRAATITAPNGPSQQACTRASLREGGLSAGEVSASECHGTGTALGDPIETSALMAVHGMERKNGTGMGMTSSKSNIGHGEENAGAAALVKCILMAKHSVCPANVHLHAMNATMVSEGFPALFTPEHLDSNSNSVIVGVNSFGFGGANSHAEIWGRARAGVRATGTIPLESYDQLTVTCPITMGQIDYLTGEPFLDSAVNAPTFGKADALRDPLADYGISRYAYEGNFRFRGGEVEDESTEDDPIKLPAGTSICVCGSWNNYRDLEKMDLTEDGRFTVTVFLGSTRCESFFLCVNYDLSLRIYPVVNNASSLISVKGPDDQGGQKYWLIDGRDNEKRMGTPYKIHFRWGRARKRVWWHEDSEPIDIKPATFEHVYSVTSLRNSYQFEDLIPSSKYPNVWVGSLHGGDSFQIVRDHDFQQAIYPSRTDAISTHVPVRGPDAWGTGKYWRVDAAADELVPLKVKIGDGTVEVTIGTQVWESIAGWGRHDYYLKTSTSSTCIPMTMSEPGIFKCIVAVETHSKEHQAYVESFQLLVDADPNHCFCPAMANSRSGAHITSLPDGQKHDEYWLIQSLWPSVKFNVTLNLTVIDRRRMVMWELLQPDSNPLASDQPTHGRLAKLKAEELAMKDLDAIFESNFESEG